MATTKDEDDRTHIIKIPRPPEWTMVDAQDAEDSDDSFSYDSGDDTEEDLHEDATEAGQHSSTSTAERGIMMSFPFLELHGIELLELVSLAIAIKCGRCKDIMDVTNLRNNADADSSGIRSVSCKKCANSLGIGDCSSRHKALPQLPWCTDRSKATAWTRCTPTLFELVTLISTLAPLSICSRGTRLIRSSGTVVC